MLGKNTIGVSYFDKEPNNKCRIIAREPRNLEDSEAFETLGHELYH